MSKSNSNVPDEDTKEPTQEYEPEFDTLDEKAARKFQLLLFNQLYRLLKDCPSAAILAVAERQLARLNMGLIEFPDNEELSDDEKKMINRFTKLSKIDEDSDYFESKE